MRVAIYARVSTEEQARHGISIEAQTAALHKWADDNGHVIVGEYIDNGVSARKSPSKRPALQSLLSDIPTKKIELVAFTKLDRWTRNVKGYYQVQDALDRNKVAWIAIQEDYETITASGRFKVNIMLSVAENEADRTSERIKSVFEHKVNLGQPITNALPIGFKIDGKRLIHDENASAAVAAFENYALNGNKSKVRDMLQNKYGIRLSIAAVTHLLHNRLYIGEYRGNPQYCDPIVPRDLFDKVQRDLDSRATRKTPSGRVYLFSGLVICKECGRRMCSVHTGEGRDYYRCSNGHTMYKDCSNHTYLRERELEDIAINKLSDAVAGLSAKYEIKQKAKPQTDNTAIQKKLDRLKELYIDGDITKEKYRQQRDELAAKLTVPKQQRTPPKVISGNNFKAEYSALSREQKKSFWRMIIDRVEVYNDGTVDIFFDLDVQRNSNQMANINSYTPSLMPCFFDYITQCQ